MTQEERVEKAPARRRVAGRWAAVALVVAGASGLAGCSSVPKAVNPVEWYRGASDTVGGWFGDDEAVPPEPGRGTAGDPGTSPDTGYPNLSTVPVRPTPSTTPAEREALRQGLVADRVNARHTGQPATGAAPPPPAPAAAPARRAVEQESAAPPAPEPQAAVPPARQPEPSRPARSGGGSGLWPNRPPPETPGLRASTTGRVGDGMGSSAAASPAPTPEPARAPMPERQASAPVEPAVQQEQAAERTTYDSTTGGWSSARPPASSPESAGVAPVPSATSQSVIVDEGAIGVGPPAASFSGRSYLASTIYFGHGSARLTAAERETVADVARTAAASGAAVQVVGHASSRTADLSLRDHEVANFAISLKRAQAVADVLIDAGVPAERVRVEALSDAQPEFYEVMPSGEAGNRRVEIVLIY